MRPLPLPDPHTRTERRIALAIAVVMLIGFASALTGCMHALRGPAAEHHLQAEVIAEACEQHGYGADKCTAETLRLLVVQACLIEAITRDEDGSACR